MSGKDTSSMSRLSTASSCLVFIGVGAALCWCGARLVQEARASRAWPTTQATITKSSSHPRLFWERHLSFVSSIAYAYKVAGRDYQGKKLRFSDVVGRSSGAISDKSKYPLGKSVLVFYRPDNPANCVLEPGDDINLYLIPGAGLCLIGLGGVVFFRLIRRGAEEN